MKILIAAASFASNISGVQRHALNLARCLLSLPEISSLHVVVAPWQLGMAQAGLYEDPRLTTHLADMNRSSFSRNLWYYLELPKLAAQLQADVVHLSCPMPLHPVAFHCPTVATLHDLYPYQIPMNFGFPKFIFNRVVLQQCLRNADAIACVSEATTAQLTQYAPRSVSRKAIRIYNCVEGEPLVAAESPIPQWTGEPFLLCIAQHRRNKNIPLLIRAFDRLLRSGQMNRDAKLVVIGIRGPETSKIHRLISAAGLVQSVHLLEGLSEPELQWCFRNCEALVAPSITEGFGLPVAEGLLAGCRIVCSDIPAHREVGGSHCRYVVLQHNAVVALTEAIATGLLEPKMPPVSLPQLAAPVLARQYVSLYRRLIASRSAVSRTAMSGSIRVAVAGPVSAIAGDRNPALQSRGK